jgi:nitroreductase / dihydropteridine reductase
MDFKELVMQRYASRAYTGERIPTEKIEQLLELVRWSPSGLNLQPWRLKVVEDAPTKAALMEAAFGQPQVGACSHLLVLCADSDLEGRIGKLEQLMRQAGSPEKERRRVIALARDMVSRMSPAQALAFAQQQVFLALAHALLGARALGFDACPMTGFDGARVAKLLGLPPQIVPTAMCPLGYGTDRPAVRVRFPREELCL